MPPCLLCERSPRLPGRYTCEACSEVAAQALTQVRVGSLAIATRHTGVCAIGERAVCVERYIRGPGSFGLTFLFAGGRFDGFSPAEVLICLRLTGEVCVPVADYAFRSAVALEADFRRGHFRQALERPAPVAGCHVCGATLHQAGLLLRCVRCRAVVMCEPHVAAFVRLGGFQRPLCASCAAVPSLPLAVH